MKKPTLLIILFAITMHCHAQTVSDVDGNVYNTVTIGTQTWMKENLKTTKYNDGSIIPNVTDNAAWGNLSTLAYCWYANSEVNYKPGRGGLYNWYTVTSNKLCPASWHVPSIEEWGALVNYLGGEALAGPKMRETGNEYYVNNADATNSSGLSLRATGVRFDDGSFTGHTFWGGWWSRTEESTTGKAKLINVDNNYLGFGANSKKWGVGVRCLKDDISNPVNTLSTPANGIYPNPAKDKLYIKNYTSPNATLMVFDLQGKLVINYQIGSGIVDISSISSGIYIVKVMDAGSIWVTKLIKE